MEQQKLPVSVKLGYGVCDLGGSLLFMVLAFWLLIYLTDTVGIAAGLAGTVVMIGRIWDAINDPIVGYVSDRTRTRWGRRRPYIFLGSIPMFLAMWILFTNPAIFMGAGWKPADHQLFLVIWGILAFCFMDTLFTIINVPYSSLTPDLTKDFHERSSLNGYRFVFAVIGTLFAAGLALPIVQAFPDKNVGFSVMGAFFGFIIMAAALVTFFSVKEPPIPTTEPEPGFFKAYVKVFKNKPYVNILFTHAVHVTAITVISGILPYYFKYVLGDEAKTTIGLVILLVTAMVFIPVSVLFSKRVGKKPVYITGMAILAVTSMVLFFFGHTMGLTFVFVLMFLEGIGLGFIYAMPWAIMPDTVEYDYLKTGVRSEGSFYGMWLFVLKLGQALAIGMTGWILAASGYVADAVQSESAAFAIRLIAGPIGAATFVIAIIIVAFYPINEKKYKEIIAGIAAMEKKRGSKATA
jgi:GPH family glycoside/pentoside/hexuronide:cation symporter